MARNETEQVRQLQRTLYRTAKQSKAVKFYSVYDKVWRMDVLREAWQQVKENRGAPGVDGETIEGIVSREEEEEMISRLQEQLRAKTYRFQPVRRVDIPKPKGGTRPLGIATVEDRVVQTAMKLVLEPIFEADFHPCSYGYRPQRDAKMASTAIRNDLYQGAWGVVEIDFRSYFTTIPHDKLIILIKQRVVDGSMLRLIKQSLTVGIAYEGRWSQRRWESRKGHRSHRSTATFTLTCWTRCGISEGTQRNWGPPCTATLMMRFSFAVRAVRMLLRHSRPSRHGWG